MKKKIPHTQTHKKEMRQERNEQQRGVLNAHPTAAAASERTTAETQKREENGGQKRDASTQTPHGGHTGA